MTPGGWSHALGFLGLAELGHGLGALRHGVLGKLTRQDQADGRLHVAASHRHALVDAAELGRLRGDLLERVRDEVVDDSEVVPGKCDVASIEISMSHTTKNITSGNENREVLVV